MYIISGDIGTANYAHSIIKVEDNKFELVKVVYLKLTQPNIGDRLLEILRNLKKDIQDYKPELLVYEDSKFAGKHAPGLHYVCGLFHLASATFNIPVRPYSPTYIKKKLTGSGKASKKEVEDAVLKLLTNPPESFENDHCSDSVAIGICAFL